MGGSTPRRSAGAANVDVGAPETLEEGAGVCEGAGAPPAQPASKPTASRADLKKISLNGFNGTSLVLTSEF